MNTMSHPTGQEETPQPGRLPMRCALLALVYFVTGKLAFEWALPPASASPIWPAAGVALAGVPKWGPRVWPGLVMDDAPFVRAFVARALELLGYEVALSTTGEEAIELFAEAHGTGRPFDVVLLDLIVPGGMGGAAALSKLHRIDPQVRAIASSGYSSSPVMAKPEEHGFAGVIAKPYTIAQLEAVLGAVLADAHVGSQLDGDGTT